MVKHCKIFILNDNKQCHVSLQDYQVDLYLRQHWHDPRLNHSEITQVLKACMWDNNNRQNTCSILMNSMMYNVQCTYIYMCQHISGCKWMSLNIGSIYILKYLGILPKTRIYGSSESAKYCDQSKVDEVLVSCGRYYHNMIIIVWYDELYYHGVNFFNLVKPLYPKSNRTWATGLQDLHWDFQSQVIQMKMYFQYHFDIFQYYF